MSLYVMTMVAMVAIFFVALVGYGVTNEDGHAVGVNWTIAGIWISIFCLLIGVATFCVQWLDAELTARKNEVKEVTATSINDKSSMS